MNELASEPTKTNNKVNNDAKKVTANPPHQLVITANNETNSNQPIQYNDRNESITLNRTVQLDEVKNMRPLNVRMVNRDPRVWKPASIKDRLGLPRINNNISQVTLPIHVNNKMFNVQLPVKNHIPSTEQLKQNNQKERPIKNRLGNCKAINNKSQQQRSPINKTIQAKKMTSRALNATRNSVESIGKQVQNVQIEKIPSLPYSSPLSQNDENSCLVLPSFATDLNRIVENPFSYLFGKVCRRFMYDNCENNANVCSLEHRFPENTLFRQKLSKIDVAGVIRTYDTFILRNEILFNKYFTDFADYFGKNRILDKLRTMVNDCTVRYKQTFFSKIIDGLIRADYDFSAALKALINSIKYRTDLTSQTIVRLILEARNRDIEPFLTVLEELSKQRNFEFTTESINRMLTIHNEKQNERLKSILLVILKGKKDISSQIDKMLLKLFWNSVKNGAENHEE